MERDLDQSRLKVLVCVTWRDAFFDFEYGDEGRRADYLVETTGYLIAEDELFVSLAQERLPEGDGHRAITNIPVATITKREVLTSDVRELLFHSTVTA